MGHSNNLKLEDAIEEFIEKGKRVEREYNNRVTVLRTGLIRELDHRGKGITIDIIESVDVINLLKEILPDVMIGLKIEKATAYKVFEKFFSFLNKKYLLQLNIDEFLKRPLKDKRERQIDILKQLHGRPMNREQLADIYYISRKTLNGDLDELEKGTEFLGQQIKIDLEINRRDKSVGYRSTVHPIFLTLNMMEVYTLTVGLKKVCKGSIYEDILNDIADAIYTQLSHYGKNLINDSMRHKGDNRWIRFSKRHAHFRQEREMFQESMQNNRLIYHEKRSFAYRKGMEIIAEIDGKAEIFKNARFTIKWPNEIRIIYGENNSEKVIKMDQLISIAAGESEYGEITDFNREK